MSWAVAMVLRSHGYFSLVNLSRQSPLTPTTLLWMRRLLNIKKPLNSKVFKSVSKPFNAPGKWLPSPEVSSQTAMTDFPPLSYTSTIEILTLSFLELEKIITQVTLASADIAFVGIHGGRVVLADPLVAKLLHNAFFDKEYTCPAWGEQSFSNSSATTVREQPIKVLYDPPPPSPPLFILH